MWCYDEVLIFVFDRVVRFVLIFVDDWRFYDGMVVIWLFRNINGLVVIECKFVVVEMLMVNGWSCMVGVCVVS